MWRMRDESCVHTHTRRHQVRNNIKQEQMREIQDSEAPKTNPSQSSITRRYKLHHGPTVP